MGKDSMSLYVIFLIQLLLLSRLRCLSTNQFQYTNLLLNLVKLTLKHPIFPFIPAVPYSFPLPPHLSANILFHLSIAQIPPICWTIVCNALQFSSDPPNNFLNSPPYKFFRTMHFSPSRPPFSAHTLATQSTSPQLMITFTIILNSRN